ncbi:MAG TPA: extracellular solute-binding protein [Candidatus Binatia bacterium]|jgi:iron(III) transport system substrate-binding protein|nr:extracellular solute-binding protein [Candidatus Binatia bacterium]
MVLRAARTGVAVLAIWLLGSATLLAQPVDIDAAKKEGKVVIYGTIVPQVMTLIEKGFEAKYGIKPEYWRGDATKVIDRVLTEWRAGKPSFDVVIGARGPLALAKPEGVFAKYSPAASANFPAKFKDKDGQLTAMRVTPVGILYNTELVKSADVPKSFDDLLDQKWQGKISMPDPSRHASTAQFLWNMEQIKGEKWIEFARGLAKQRPHLVESYSSVPNAIVRGESAVGITYVQYAGQTKGPISFAPIDKLFADPSDAALSSKSPNMNAGKLFIEYLCSAEGQKKVADTGEFVLAPGVYPNIKGADKIMASLLLMNDTSGDQLAKLQSEFRQLFLAK